jgi:hypothetical protein
MVVWSDRLEGAGRAYTARPTEMALTAGTPSQVGAA